MVKLNLDPKDFVTEDCIPADDYELKIVKVENEENSKQTGRNLWLTFKVSIGKHKGRTFRQCFAYDNPNPTAVRIAAEKLTAAWLSCGGKGLLKNSDDLHGKTVVGRVVIAAQSKKDADGNIIQQYDPKNEVKKFLVLDTPSVGEYVDELPDAPESADSDDDDVAF